MNIKEWLKKNNLLIGTLAGLLLVQNSAQGEVTVGAQKKESAKQETRDRHVDQAALQSQESAVLKLKALLNKYRGTAQEPLLMMRLAQVYQESAAIEFRIAYGRAHQARTQPQLARYKLIQTGSVEILTQLIQKHPRFDSLDLCYFMRGKAYEELSKKEEAKGDYLQLVRRYPESNRNVAAFMALAEMAIEKNQHAEAVGYLTKVEKVPSSPQYPFALYKLAWSSVNLKDYARSIGYLERHINYYDGLKKGSRIISPADSAMRENSLLDMVTFYSDANENAGSAFPLNNALDYFRKLEKGPVLGKMELRMTKILRAHRRDRELVAWKDSLLKEEKTRPETVESVMTVLEHLWNQRKLTETMEMSRDLLTLYQVNDAVYRESASFVAARKKLGDFAEELQKTLVEHKSAENSGMYLKILSELYNVFIQIVPDTDPRIGQIHYNLAETLFDIGQFDQATRHYRWILDHWNSKGKLARGNIQLKAVVARYNKFKKEGLIPQELKAQRLDEGTQDDLKKKLSPETLEWISWVEDLPETPENSSPKVGSPAGTLDRDNVVFEANRLIYRYGSTRVAAERFIDFSADRPKSRFAIPSATLVLDSYIKSSDWKGCRDLARRLVKKTWPETFSTRLITAGSDCTFKVAENAFNAKDFNEAMDWVEVIQKEFPKSPRAADGMMLASKILMEKKEEKGAQKILSQLIREYPSSSNSKNALLTRAGLQERSYDFTHAIEDYQKYLSQPKVGAAQDSAAEVGQVRKRLVFLKWINGGSNQKACQQSFNDEQIAQAEALESSAQRMAALDLFVRTCDAPSKSESETHDPALKRVIRLATHGPQENRVVWALLGLKKISVMDLRNRLGMIKAVAKNWDDLDPLVKVSMLPEVNSAIPQHLSSIRNEVRRLVPVNRASPQAISRRVEWIKEVDGAGSAALNLPWSRIRTEVLFQLALVYMDFANTLKAIPTPKDLQAPGSEKALADYQNELGQITQPFLSRSQELGQKAMEVATGFGVENELIRKIAGEFPGVSGKFESEFKKQNPKADSIKSAQLIGLNLIQIGEVKAKAETVGLVRIWMEAYQGKNWAKSGFILQEMIQKKELPESLIRTMQGLTLMAAGSQAEGLHELLEAAALMEPKSRTELKMAILKQYIQSGSAEQVSKLIREVESESQVASSEDTPKKQRKL